MRSWARQARQRTGAGGRGRESRSRMPPPAGQPKGGVRSRDLRRLPPSATAMPTCTEQSPSAVHPNRYDGVRARGSKIKQLRPASPDPPRGQLESLRRSQSWGQLESPRRTAPERSRLRVRPHQRPRSPPPYWTRHVSRNRGGRLLGTSPWGQLETPRGGREGRRLLGTPPRGQLETPRRGRE